MARGRQKTLVAVEILKMSSIDLLPEMDFSTDDYRSHPFQSLAKQARSWRIARSSRGVEVLDYDLCRSMIVDRRLGTGHPKLMHLLGLPDGRGAELQKGIRVVS